MGILSRMIDDLLEEYNISDDTIKTMSDLMAGIMKHINIKTIGDTTHITFEINNITAKLKRSEKQETKEENE